MLDVERRQEAHQAFALDSVEDSGHWRGCRPNTYDARYMTFAITRTHDKALEGWIGSFVRQETI